MFSQTNQKDEKFDIIKSDFDAYKRWGYATDYTPKVKIGNEIVETKNEKKEIFPQRQET